MTSLPISFIGDFYGISWIHWQYYWRLTTWYPWCLSCQYHWWVWCHLLDNLIANNIDFLFDLLDDFVVNDHWWLWCDLLGDFVGKIIVDFVIYFLDNFRNSLIIMCYHGICHFRDSMMNKIQCSGAAQATTFLMIRNARLSNRWGQELRRGVIWIQILCMWKL